VKVSLLRTSNLVMQINTRVQMAFSPNCEILEIVIVEVNIADADC
jgi:hypothetical protein